MNGEFLEALLKIRNRDATIYQPESVLFPDKDIQNGSAELSRVKKQKPVFLRQVIAEQVRPSELLPLFSKLVVETATYACLSMSRSATERHVPTVFGKTGAGRGGQRCGRGRGGAGHLPRRTG